MVTTQHPLSLLGIAFASLVAIAAAVWLFVRDQTPELTLSGHSSDVLWMILVSDDCLISGGSEGAIVWSRSQGTMKRRFGSGFYCAAPVEGTSWMVIGGANGRVELWDWTTGTLVRPLPGATGATYSVSASANGQLIAAGNGLNTDRTDGPIGERQISLWDIKGGQPISRLRGHQGTISYLAFADGVLISASFDQTIRKWDVQTASQTGVLGTPHADYSAGPPLFRRQTIDLSPDGRLLLRGSKVIDVETMKPVDEVPVLRMTARAFIGSDRVVAFGTSDGEVGAYDRVERREVWRRLGKQNKAEVSCLMYSPDGWLFAAGQAENPPLAAWEEGTPQFDTTIRAWKIME